MKPVEGQILDILANNRSLPTKGILFQLGWSIIWLGMLGELLQKMEREGLIRKAYGEWMR